MKKNIKNHPFYCFKKKCQKTAWSTPEYLSIGDWDLIEILIPIIKKKDHVTFYNSYNNNLPLFKSFFYIGVGWPEGYKYCWNETYLVNMGMSVLFNDLPNLKLALKNFKKAQKTLQAASKK